MHINNKPAHRGALEIKIMWPSTGTNSVSAFPAACDRNYTSLTKALSSRVRAVTPNQLMVFSCFLGRRASRWHFWSCTTSSTHHLPIYCIHTLITCVHLCNSLAKDSMSLQFELVIDSNKYNRIQGTTKYKIQYSNHLLSTVEEICR